jgi:hypothetical protein
MLFDSCTLSASLNYLLEGRFVPLTVFVKAIHVQLLRWVIQFAVIKVHRLGNFSGLTGCAVLLSARVTTASIFIWYFLKESIAYVEGVGRGCQWLLIRILLKLSWYLDGWILNLANANMRGFVWVYTIIIAMIVRTQYIRISAYWVLLVFDQMQVHHCLSILRGRRWYDI